MRSEKELQAETTSKCQGPEAEVRLVCLRNRKETSVIKGEHVGDEVEK